MSHRIEFGVAAAFTAVLAFGSSCQKNGETEMRPASGVNPDYKGEQRETVDPPWTPESAYPRPGSGTGVPGTQTTPGATEPGVEELPRGGDRTTLPPGGFPVEDEPTLNEPPDTWGADPATGGTSNRPAEP